MLKLQILQKHFLPPVSDRGTPSQNERQILIFLRMCEPNSNAPKKSCWAPALRSLSIEIMDKILYKPTASCFCSQFTTIRENLIYSKYKNVSEWKDSMLCIFMSALNSESDYKNESFSIICEDLKNWFLKRYHNIEKLSNFEFRDVIQSTIDENEFVRDEK